MLSLTGRGRRGGAPARLRRDPTTPRATSSPLPSSSLPSSGSPRGRGRRRTAMNNGTGVHRSALSATACHKQDPGYQGSAARCRCPSASARDGLATPCAAVPQRSVGEVCLSPSGAMLPAPQTHLRTYLTTPQPQAPLPDIARAPPLKVLMHAMVRSIRCIASRITVINNRYNNMR